MAGVIEVIRLRKQIHHAGFKYKHHIYIFYFCLCVIYSYSGAIEYPAGSFPANANIVPVVIQSGSTSGIFQT